MKHIMTQEQRQALSALMRVANIARAEGATGPEAMDIARQIIREGHVPRVGPVRDAGEWSRAHHIDVTRCLVRGAIARRRGEARATAPHFPDAHRDDRMDLAGGCAMPVTLAFLVILALLR